MKINNYYLIVLKKMAAEWWKSDTEAVINEATRTGLAPNVSDAHTINGFPGPVSNCPSEGIDVDIFH